MRTWIKCQQTLSPVQSPLASFVYHPKFQDATHISSFQRWEQASMDKLGKAGLELGGY